jgi:hypothetical protein
MLLVNVGIDASIQIDCERVSGEMSRDEFCGLIEIALQYEDVAERVLKHPRFDRPQAHRQAA